MMATWVIIICRPTWRRASTAMTRAQSFKPILRALKEWQHHLAPNLALK